MNRRSLLAALPLIGFSCAEAATLSLDLHGATASVDAQGVAGERLPLIREWIGKCADAVVIYYGKFPVPQVAITLEAVDGGKVGGGRTEPGDIPHIEIHLGREADQKVLLQDDWVLVHEMIHLAFPWMNMQHNWMAEGIAVYVESIARVQAGHLKPEQIWGDFVKAMPKGLPKDGDGGLDRTASWGMTYWGGCMFCLMADIRIRQETENRFGLQSALRGINAERDFRKEWDFRDTLELGDRATGRHVLVNQYEEMKDKPVKPDLDQLWKELGIVKSESGIAFDDGAPLASIRSAITKPQPA
jgi:hypothetical protein